METVAAPYPPGSAFTYTPPQNFRSTPAPQVEGQPPQHRIVTGEVPAGGTMEESQVQSHVGPEWGQQFVENFFQHPGGTAAGSMTSVPMYYGAADGSAAAYSLPAAAGGGVNSSSTYLPPYTTEPYYTTSNGQAGTYGPLATPLPSSYPSPNPSLPYNYSGYGGGAAYTTLPLQTQGTSFSPYNPGAIGGQVYAMPPTTKKSSHKKKKASGCC